jgi:hypothetical protein
MAYDHEEEYIVPAQSENDKRPQQGNNQSPGDEVKVKCHLCKQFTDDILKHLQTFHDKTKQVNNTFYVWHLKTKGQS